MSSISERMVEALNEQLNWELYSAYIYLSMAAYFDSIELKGFANWMRVQWQEEITHAMRFYDYINERGGRVKLHAIQEPKAEWSSPLEAFEEAYNHEVGVTKRIHNLIDLALSEKDYATYNMLQWFVAEQVEEEASTSEIVGKLRIIGEDKHALLMLDQELGKRRFNPPADGQEV
ncbi:ferritin-like domain-containing protein [Geoglobus acetivorans]|uniref:Ferritin n=1 Tax=Geoglobus acetivorans TaxID=565033 RepID=A0ABZ3H4S7_GEOAI|nr:ferritin [Geoglobus acetivorans]